jgi:ABC-type glycerol-3-phosphate transport system permease component
MNRYIRSKKRQDIIIELVLLITTIIWVVPVAAALNTSLKVKGLENYITVLSTKIDGNVIFFKMFINSIIITIITMLLILINAVLAAYAFSKMKFKGKNVLYLGILGCFAIPMISTLIPNLFLMTRFGLRGTYISMILLLVTVNLPLALMIFKSNFDGLPNAFLEAAIIDGSSRLNTLVSIVIPMSTPVIVNVLVVMFIQIWNDFQIPLIFAIRTEMYTLTLAPKFFGLTSNRLDLPPLYASIIIIAIPVVIFYIVMQDKIIQGMSLGGLKE